MKSLLFGISDAVITVLYGHSCTEQDVNLNHDFVGTLVNLSKDRKNIHKQDVELGCSLC